MTRTRNRLTAGITKYAAQATVEHVESVTPSMRRIRLIADRPVEFHYAPGQHIRIQINDPLSLYGILRPGETLRTYTIWEFVRSERVIELLVHLYQGDGIGLRWAQTVDVGDPVTFWWPKNDFQLREAAHHVFIGDETAAAAFGPMIRQLGETASVYGVLESEAPEHDLAMPGGHDLRRAHRHGASASYSRILADATAALDLPGQPGAAYIAGEARTCQMVRTVLETHHGWPRSAIKVKPFWTPGKRGLH